MIDEEPFALCQQAYPMCVGFGRVSGWDAPDLQEGLSKTPRRGFVLPGEGSCWPPPLG